MEDWFAYLREKKIGVIGWGDDNWYGKAFKEKINPGDLLIIAQGNNANKRLCLVGIVSGDALDDNLDDAPGEWDYYRKLEPSVVLGDNPADYGLSFEKAAYGEAKRVPSLYQLYPVRNEADRRIVVKMLELIGMDTGEFDKPEPEDELKTLIDEFRKTYMDTGDGEYHRKILLQGREQGRKNYRKVLDLQEQGEDITNAVLHGLLPHADTETNRSENRWIHIASAITGDIRHWFERAGWAKSAEWPSIAREIFKFVRNAVERPEEFSKLCAEFDDTFPYRGFQVGMLTPILSVVKPEHYVVVNAEPIAVINWLTRSSYRPRVREIPMLTVAIRQWVDENCALFEPMTLEGLTLYEIFDMFCHWLKAVKKYPLKLKAQSRRFERYGRGSSEAARKVFQKIFPDEVNRNAAESFLVECIQKAHSGNSNNWEVTLGPHYMMFNVAFVRVFRLHFKELHLFLLGSAFKPELREKYADVIEFSEDHFKSFDEEIGKCIIAPEKFAGTVADVKYAILQFIQANSVRAKSSIWAGSHSPGVLEYLRQSTGLDIPSPDFEDEVVENAIEDEEEESGLPPNNLHETLESVGAKTEEPQTPPYEEDGLYRVHTIEDCCSSTGIPATTLEMWKRALGRKKQAVFYGPPGTGKTFVAHQLAKHIVGGTDGIIDCIQFHPAYSYEEFMQGIRPTVDYTGNLIFRTTPGRFLEFCSRAKRRTGPCVLIIDEINRANLSRVFGELMYLLEYRESEIPLAGGTRFAIPSNVRILGTMNTADRSIALVDFALRRRFAFLELAPEYDILIGFHQKQGFDAAGLVAVLREVNTKINDKNFSLGISFFMVEKLGDEIEDIWTMEIETYLEEFFFSRPEAVNNFRWGRVKDRIVP